MKKSSDFGTSNLIESLGIVLLIALGIVIFLMLFFLVKYLVLNNYRYYRMYMNVSDKIFYNTFIRYGM